jgi:hypothetical protein
MKPFRKPFVRQVHDSLTLLSYWDSPLPAEFGLNPLFDNWTRGSENAAVRFARYEPRAYVRRWFEGRLSAF